MTTDRSLRIVYLAQARIRIEQSGEVLRELRWLLEAAEGEMVRLAKLPEAS